MSIDTAAASAAEQALANLQHVISTLDETVEAVARRLTPIRSDGPTVAQPQQDTARHGSSILVRSVDECTARIESLRDKLRFVLSEVEV